MAIPILKYDIRLWFLSKLFLVKTWTEIHIDIISAGNLNHITFDDSDTLKRMQLKH